MIDGIVPSHKWLLMLANELESKHFPPGYGPQLRHIATILESSQLEVAKLDNLNIQLGVELADREHQFARLRRDATEMWQRYQNATEVVSKYEPDRGLAMSNYKPEFHEIL